MRPFLVAVEMVDAVPCRPSMIGRPFVGDRERLTFPPNHCLLCHHVGSFDVSHSRELMLSSELFQLEMLVLPVWGRPSEASSAGVRRHFISGERTSLTTISFSLSPYVAGCYVPYH